MSTSLATQVDPLTVANAFALDGPASDAAPYGTGHINDTFCVEAGRRRYILQRLNGRVFADLPGLMDNVARCCAHLQTKLAGDPEAWRKALSLIPTTSGAPFLVDALGATWRCYPFIEGSLSRERVETPAEAEAVAQAFGSFLRDLADLPGGPLVETIPDFHHTPRRLRQLEAALTSDPLRRAASCREEIAFVWQRSDFARCIQTGIDDGSLPLRVTHNDTKINNVLLDAASQRGLCVIDLDTLMPGSPLFDIADVLRTTISTAAEDEPDPRRIAIRMDVLRAVYGGFARALDGELNAAERALLPNCAAFLAFECGTRFLTDHLAGDVYFKVHRPGHNLDRARAQFAIVARCEERIEEIAAICAETFA